jgi:hypothetical protein
MLRCVAKGLALYAAAVTVLVWIFHKVRHRGPEG